MMKFSNAVAAFTTALVGCALVCGSTFGQTNKRGSDFNAAKKISQGLAKIVDSPKTNAKDAPFKETEPEPEPRFVRAGVPIPQNAGVVLSAPSLNALDKTVGAFFKNTSDTEFSVLAALRLTDYRRLFATIDLDAEIGFVAFCETAPPKFALVLPVSDKKFKPFVDALAQTAPKETRASSVSPDGKTATISLELGEKFEVAARKLSNGFVALTLAEDAELLKSFESNNLVRYASGLKAGLNEPAFSIEATPEGLQALTSPDRPFWLETAEALLGVEQTLKDAQVDANLTEIRERVRQNLMAVRVDVALDDFGVYVSTQTKPRPNSPEEKRLASFGPLSPLNADADRFFGVLPDAESPVSGQTEIAADFAKTLPKPFNRVRFVEFSLNLPLQTELAAESWQIFLEVDDADEFVKEMVIPKARAIGSYIGSKQVEDVGAQVFGAIAERRRDRQDNRRRPPRRAVDPEQAAARGAALGNLLGGAIGADSAESMAMKQYKFDEFPMYISDLETYARQTKLMKAEAEGTAPERESKLVFDRNRPLLSSLDVMLANVGSGENLQTSMLRSANEEAEKVDSSPLFARKSNIVVLDKKHVLMGLGNQELLHLAVNNWKATKSPSVRYLTTVHDFDGVRDLQALCAKIPNVADSKFVSAIRLDLPRAQAYYKWLAQVYFPSAPVLPIADLPDDTPKALVLSCVAGSNEYVRVVAPHKTIAQTFATVFDGKTPLQVVMQSKQNADAPENDENAGEDLDDLFDE